MIKVNLISRKQRAYRGRNWTRIITLSIFGAISAYFLGTTLYVIISMVVIKGKIAKVNTESTAISSVMLGNNEKLSRFVLTKLILTKIQEINKERFHYKDYLDQVSILLPSGSTMVTVDFTLKGWISLSVKSDNLNSFNTLEKTLLDKASWTGNKFFSAAYIESVSKDKTGSYSTRLQLELKKING